MTTCSISHASDFEPAVVQNAGSHVTHPVSRQTPAFSSVRVIEYTEGIFAIGIKPTEPVQIEFPANISKIVTAITPDVASIERVDNKLYIIVPSQISHALFVITNDNKSYHLYLDSNKLQSDTNVKIVNAIEKVKKEIEDAKTYNHLELVRDMALGIVKHGVTVSDTAVVLFEDDSYKIVANKQFSTPIYLAYLFVVETKKQDVPFVYEKINIKNRILLVLEDEYFKESNKGYLVTMTR